MEDLNYFNIKAAGYNTRLNQEEIIIDAGANGTIHIGKKALQDGFTLMVISNSGEEHITTVTEKMLEE